MSQETKTIRPEYYQTDSPYEPIKIIRYYNLEFERANSLKYILRAGVKNKETEHEDLIKAITYLQLRVDFLEAKKQAIEVTLNINDTLMPKIEEAKSVIHKWNDSDKPKIIEDLKVGDNIKAILTKDKDGFTVTKGEYYEIVSINNNYYSITEENGFDYHFNIDNLKFFFHVTHKDQGILTEENKRIIEQDETYNESKLNHYH
jgi:hypothetical protein